MLNYLKIILFVIIYGVNNVYCAKTIDYKAKEWIEERYNYTINCMPGSVFYNGMCYFLSNKYQKLSWFDAYDFCSEMNLNATLLIVDNVGLFQNLTQTILKIKENEPQSYQDHLVYHIGFNYTTGGWKWVNNVSVTNSSFNFFNVSTEYGKCGTLVMLDDTRFVLRSSRCQTSKEQFICGYMLNRCFNNSICGNNGKCINYIYKLHCECTSIFYEGEYCDKISSKGIQKVFGIIFIIIFILSLLNVRDLLKYFKRVLNSISKFSKKCFKKEINATNSKLRGLKQFLKYNINKEKFLFFVSVCLLSILIIYLLEITKITSKDKIKLTRTNNAFINQSCTFFESYYWSEQLIHSVLAVIAITVLLVRSGYQRYSSYIMRKYNNFFQSEDYKTLKTQLKGPQFSRQISTVSAVSVVMSRKCASSCSLPLIPFSTVNRLQSSLVYVAYTYDILDIVIYVLYTTYVLTTVLSKLDVNQGIIYDFLIHILQIVIVGLKFYPILIIADMSPSIFEHFVGLIYIIFAFLLKTLNKLFCSRHDYYFKYLYNKTAMQVQERSMNSENDAIDQEKRYMANIQTHLPTLFDKYFNSNTSVYTTPLPTTRKFGGRTNLMATTFGQSIKKSDLGPTIGLNVNDADFNKILFNTLENLPLYIFFSYFVLNYLFSLLKLLSEKLRDLCEKANKQFEEKDVGATKQLIIEQIKLNYRKENKLDVHKINDKNNSRNTSYMYIRSLLTGIRLFDDDKRIHIRKRPFRFIDLFSFLYKPKEHLRFSKEFFNTYTVSFLIVYLITLYMFRMSVIFQIYINKAIELSHSFLHPSLLPSDKLEYSYLNNEYTFSCIAAMLFVILQLILSIKSFQEHVMYLHKGGKKSPDGSKSNMIHTFNKSRDTLITENSFHFQGYMIVQLVLAYIIVFITTLVIVLFIKFIFQFPYLFNLTIELLLPTVLMILLKSFSLKSLTNYAVFRTKKHSINLPSYFIVNYFNFFFDCFLGFNQFFYRKFTSFIILPRVDVSLYNQQNEFVLKLLDKSHLAYVSFVHMEHKYNNPVVKGFCELLIESMFLSFIHKKDLEKDRSKPNTPSPCSEATTIVRLPSRIDSLTPMLTSTPITTDPPDILTDNAPAGSPKSLISQSPLKVTKPVNYESFRKLRNILFLYILLSKNKYLQQYTAKNIQNNASDNSQNDSKNSSKERKSKCCKCCHKQTDD